MKSYFLEHLPSLAVAEAALTEELPAQREPWVLLDDCGDAVAYLHLNTSMDARPHLPIQADISGRHYQKDAIVVALLRRLQQRTGGILGGDD